jgi:YggT family protein
LTQFLLAIIQLFLLAIFGRVILSWLLGAGMRNDFILRMDRALGLFTDPIMRPLRRIIPPLGMFDVTPMVAIILLIVLQRFIIATV